MRNVAGLYSEQSEDLAMAMAVYMLGFNTYAGFCKQVSQTLNEGNDGMLKRIYEYAKHLQ